METSNRQVLLDLRERIREIYFNTTIPLEARLREHDQKGKGRIKMSLFTKILCENQIVLGEGEKTVLFKQFGRGTLDICYTDFLTFLSILPPRDYNDPELNYPKLPQPYRRIVKVLEEDILYPVMQKIAEKLDKNMSKDKEENEAKERVCYPSSQFDTDIVSGITAIRCSYEQSKMVTLNTRNQLQVLDLNYNTVLDESDVFPQTYRSTLLSNLCASVAENDKTLKIAVYGRLHSLARSQDETVLDQENEENEQEFLVNVYEISAQGSICFVGMVISECPVRAITISPDGMLLTIANEKNTAFVYLLPETPASIETPLNGELAPILQDPDKTEHGDGSAKQGQELRVIEQLVYTFPQPEVENGHGQQGELGVGTEGQENCNENKSRLFFYFSIAAATTRASHHPIARCVALTYGYEGENKLYKCSILWKTARNKRFLIREDEQTLEEPKEPAEDSSVVKFNLEFTWTLPSTISCTSQDLSTTLIGIGLRNGSIVVWNLISALEQCMVESHENPVESMAFYRQKYLMSIDSTNEIQFYNLEPDQRAQADPQQLNFHTRSNSSYDSYIVPSYPEPISFASIFNGSEDTSTSAKYLMRVVSSLVGQQPFDWIGCFEDIPIGFVCIASQNFLGLYDLRVGALIGCIGLDTEGEYTCKALEMPVPKLQQETNLVEDEKDSKDVQDSNRNDHESMLSTEKHVEKDNPVEYLSSVIRGVTGYKFVLCSRKKVKASGGESKAENNHSGPDDESKKEVETDDSSLDTQDPPSMESEDPLPGFDKVCLYDVDKLLCTFFPEYATKLKKVDENISPSLLCKQMFLARNLSKQKQNDSRHSSALHNSCSSSTIPSSIVSANTQQQTLRSNPSGVSLGPSKSVVSSASRAVRRVSMARKWFGIGQMKTDNSTPSLSSTMLYPALEPIKKSHFFNTPTNNWTEFVQSELRSQREIREQRIRKMRQDVLSTPQAW